MENRPVGRVKKVVSGGTGIKKTGEGLGKTISKRNVKRDEEAIAAALKRRMTGGTTK